MARRVDIIEEDPLEPRGNGMGPIIAGVIALILLLVVLFIAFGGDDEAEKVDNSTNIEQSDDEAEDTETETETDTETQTETETETTEEETDTQPAEGDTTG